MKRTIAALMMVMLAAMPFALTASAATATNAVSVPVTGAGSGATFAGTFTLQKFVTDGTQVLASGILSGTLTNTVTGAVTSVVQTVTMPVTVGQTTCQILHLDLGPISLNILGLQIDLSRVVLDITAQGGSGNLLGNLLCSVANLLNNPGSLANLLNQILAAL